MADLAYCPRSNETCPQPQLLIIILINQPEKVAVIMMTDHINQLESIARQLEPDLGARQQWLDQVVAYSQQYLESIAASPASFPAADGRLFISSTQLDGRFTLRLAISSFRTHLEHIELALEALQTTAQKLQE